MNTFTVLLFCIQALLVQSAYSQCINNGGLGVALIAPSAIPSRHGCGGISGIGLGGVGVIGNAGEVGLGASSAAAWGGVGEGNVAVGGEVPVVGNTAVIGQVPILGAVSFGGEMPASGCVSINGRCACQCTC